MRNRTIVTNRALLARINRKLRPDDQWIRKRRGEYQLMMEDGEPPTSPGGYLCEADVDLEHFGRSIGVLLPSERLRQE
jgi:hypothetical protein